jgi:hypothetical protein
MLRQQFVIYRIFLVFPTETNRRFEYGTQIAKVLVGNQKSSFTKEGGEPKGSRLYIRKDLMSADF